MRIVAGDWRGRALIAPPGQATRPTADRVRQALFDMLLHAPWGGRHVVEGAHVLDAFAGTGAMGLEALSRGAAHASFIERDRAAIGALRENIAACRAADRCTIFATDVLAAPQGSSRGCSGGPSGAACSLVFLDPPYGESLLAPALRRLRAAGWLAPGALVVAETGRTETVALPGPPLAERTHGAARLTVWAEPA